RDVLAVAKKVTVRHDDESEAIYPSTRLGKVRLETTDGNKYDGKVFHPKGSPENPLSNEELRRKFMGLAAMVLSQEKSQRIMETVESLEQLKNVTQLTELLATSA
ncbi:MAG TPA: MmgE/PrpD family protein, partial [Candidatus Binatia bacterium]